MANEGEQSAAQAPAGWYPGTDGDPNHQQYWDGQRWTDQTRELNVFDRIGGAGRAPSLDHAAKPVELNQAGAVLAVIGALGMLIGAFLPQVESTRFIRVKDNSLIQNGDGWALVVLAVLISLAVYAAWRRQRQTWAVFIIAVIGLAGAIYDGTGDRLDLTSASPSISSSLGVSATEHGSPGVGIYVVGVGAGLAAVGGLLLAGIGVGAARGIPARRTRQCPDCAETILADARVCKHCGYRFDGKASAAWDQEAAATPTESIPAGWFPDPARQAEERYWNGSEWTGDVRGDI